MGEATGAFECVLVGGSCKATASKEIISKIKIALTVLPAGMFRIQHEEPLSKDFALKSLCLDLRDGAIGTYDSEKDDPAPRMRNEEETERLETSELYERLVYRY